MNHDENNTTDSPVKLIFAPIAAPPITIQSGQIEHQPAGWVRVTGPINLPGPIEVRCGPDKPSMRFEHGLVVPEGMVVTFAPKTTEIVG